HFWNDDWTIVGVLPDYHSMSLHHVIEPLIFVPAYGTGNKLSLRVDTEDMEATIGYTKATFDDFFPGNFFEYAFVDDTFNRLYENDRRFARILGFFTLVAVLIACLGLFGLASYMTFLRTKEIGVRKILGATTSGLLILLSRDFLKLVGIALLIATPIAWYFLNQWLAEFPYRVAIEWWMFIAAGAVAGLVAFLAVGLQSLQAATANPVESLRSE
ncbi:MAG: ABC transporter permease, partial [Sinomicrobium sp.]|nr:ABC transporter permease [Sinomicrobium sp.]